LAVSTAIRFNSRPIKLPVVQQRLALPAGQYRLSYRFKEIGLGEKPATFFDVRCVGVAGDSRPSSDADTRGEDGWIIRSFLFNVPSSCKGQIASLAFSSRFDMLNGLRGIAYFDDMRITRLTPLPN
jgi:hypothetical protein